MEGHRLACFSGDGDKMATVSFEDVVSWGHQSTTMKNVVSVFFDVMGDLKLITVDAGKTVRLLSTSSDPEKQFDIIWEVDIPGFRDAVFSPDGQTVALMSDANVRFWGTFPDVCQIQQIDGNMSMSPVDEVSLSYDGSFFLCKGSDGSWRMFNVDTGTRFFADDFLSPSGTSRRLILNGIVDMHGEFVFQRLSDGSCIPLGCGASDHILKDSNGKVIAVNYERLKARAAKAVNMELEMVARQILECGADTRRMALSNFLLFTLESHARSLARIMPGPSFLRELRQIYACLKLGYDGSSRIDAYVANVDALCALISACDMEDDVAVDVKYAIEEWSTGPSDDVPSIRDDDVEFMAQGWGLMLMNVRTYGNFEQM
jgi:hypothetical protein